MSTPLYFSNSKVGVGNPDPQTELDVTGNLTVSGTITAGGSPVGAITVAAFGSTPSAGGASASGSTLTLQPADLTHPGGVSIAAQTFNGAKTFDDGVISDSVTSATAATVALTSSVADGAAAIAVKSNSSVALANATAKIHSFQNNSVAKAAVLQDGTITAAGLTAQTAATLPLTSSVADGAAAIAVKSNSSVALANATAKIHSFQNNSVEKASVLQDGTVTAAGLTAQTAATLPLTSSVADGASAIAVKSNSSVALSNATSIIHDFQNNGSSKASVYKNGEFVSGSGGYFRDTNFDQGVKWNSVDTFLHGGTNGDVHIGNQNNSVNLSVKTAVGIDFTTASNSANKTLKYAYTDSSGTPATSGTVNKMSGRFAITAAQQTFTLTNSNLTAACMVLAQVVSDDATAKSVVVSVSGTTATFKLDAACTAACTVDWVVLLRA